MKSPFENARPATLEQVLAARENRAAAQRALLAAHGGPLVSFTLALPGEYKRYPLAEQAFAEGQALVERQLRRQGAGVRHRQAYSANTGCEALWAVAAEARRLKGWMAEIEDSHPLGRLFDLDVLDESGTPVGRARLGLPQRTCLVCGGPVWACARSRRHPARELALRAATLFEEYFAGQYARQVAMLAERALLYEVAITPKPGLVDLAGPGAHRDMDVFTFMASAGVLRPYFEAITAESLAFGGRADGLLERLRFTGQEAEDAMLAATGGVNTHKGAIYSLGLVCAAAGLMYRDSGGPPSLTDTGALLALCGQIAAGAVPGAPGRAQVAAQAAAQPETQADTPAGQTHGARVRARHGMAGARGEAAAGFPGVRQYGLPALRRALAAGCPIQQAGVAALLALMARVEDTNIVYRAGPQALAWVRQTLGAFLKGEPDIERIIDFAASLEQEFQSRNISPGGSADLLAVTLLVWLLSAGDVS